MKELKLQGYVTPGDCGGDLQKAVDLAAQTGLNKVVVDADCTAATPVVLPSGLYLVIRNAVLTADLVTRQEENYSFRTRYLTIEGAGGRICGNIHMFHVHHVNICGVEMEGRMTFEYCLWGRVQRVAFHSGGLQVGRGCGNFIIEELDSQVPAVISGAVSCGKIIPGTKPDVNNIILCDSRFHGDGVLLDGAEDCGLLNIQADHITAGGSAVVVGSGKDLPDTAFFNLTFTDLSGPVVYQNAARHIYEK